MVVDGISYWVRGPAGRLCRVVRQTRDGIRVCWMGDGWVDRRLTGDGVGDDKRKCQGDGG